MSSALLAHAKPPSERQFGLVLGAASGLAGAWIAWRHGSPAAGVFLVLAGAALAGFALWSPGVLVRPNRAWFRLGLALGAVTSPIAMAVLFYGIVAPVGLLRRAVSPDPLRRRRDAATPTYWQARPDPVDGAFFDRQF